MLNTLATDKSVAIVKHRKKDERLSQVVKKEEPGWVNPRWFIPLWYIKGKGVNRHRYTCMV